MESRTKFPFMNVRACPLRRSVRRTPSPMIPAPTTNGSYTYYGRLAVKDTSLTVLYGGVTVTESQN